MATGTAFALVDAFTTGRAFSGNPAGVLLLDSFPDDAWMQGVANELQQAETAFLTPATDGQFQLRWFTSMPRLPCAGTPRSPVPNGSGRPACWLDRPTQSSPPEAGASGPPAATT